MGEEQTFDALYVQILQQGRGIEPLFHSLFSFMRRKTDFFANADQGFLECEKAFRAHKMKFEQDKQKEKEKRDKDLKKKKEAEEKQKEKDKKVDSGVTEITKEEFERRKREEDQKINNQNENVDQIESKKVEVKKEEKSKSDKKGEEEDSEDIKRREKCAKMDESERKELLKKTAHLEDKNGGRTRNYTWVQNQVEHFEMYIPIDSDIRGNQIKIDYSSKNMTVKIKGETIITGDLYAPINSDSFIWTLDEVKGKKVISITFEKLYRMQWWDHVIKGDELLTLSTVNPDPSKLSDLDADMRPEIEKMMIENSMKMQNKPYHKEPKTNDLLQKFMKEHPEMDFSKAQIN
jgi:hypothetical protein